MFKDRLMKLRVQKGMTQTTLAKELNVCPSTISMYEQGRRMPRQELLLRLAEKFDVSVDYLIGRNNYVNQPKKIDALEQELYAIYSNLEGKPFHGKYLNRKDIDLMVDMTISGIQAGLEEKK